MNKLSIGLATAVLVISGSAAANHYLNPGPYASRGDCEVEKQEQSNADMNSLLERFPNLFSSRGEVRSFLNRAFTCESADGVQWYLVDHRPEILGSEWFLRRKG